MTSIRSRPRFRHVTQSNLTELKAKIKAGFEGLDNTVTGSLEESFCTLKIIEKEQHFWSPHLNVNFEESEEGTILRGRYGPNPSIWTLFALAYSALGLTFTAISLYGLTRLSLNLDAAVLYLLPFIFLGILSLYVFAQVGQKLGAEQTFRIHRFFEEKIEEKIHLH